MTGAALWGAVLLHRRCVCDHVSLALNLACLLRTYVTRIKRHLSNKYRHGDVPCMRIYLLQAPADNSHPLGRREESKTVGDLS